MEGEDSCAFVYEGTEYRIKELCSTIKEVEWRKPPLCRLRCRNKTRVSEVYNAQWQRYDGPTTATRGKFA